MGGNNVENDNWEDFWIEYEEKELKIQKNKVWKFILVQVVATIFTGILLAWLIIKQL